MSIFNKPSALFCVTASLVLAAGLSTPAYAQLAVAQTPLSISAGQSAPPLNMLVMGRDHKLYYEAYNDASDINGDGVIDIGYKPEIDYYGYFNNHACYEYTGSTGSATSQAAADGHFVPRSAATDKKCSGRWSGDYLNYLATSRMDALRRVFYGGYRSVDSTSETILEAAFIPQDGHAWGKAYDPTIDDYRISDYTPLSNPSNGRRHVFAVTTMGRASAGNRTQLRVLQNTSWDVWDWVSRQSSDGQGNAKCGTLNFSARNGASGIHNCIDSDRGTIVGYNVRVKACTGVADAYREDACKSYPNNGTAIYKPTGLLHDFGESEKMFFGLLTGSHQRNIAGGIVRRNISSFAQEVNAQTGQFRSDVEGIVTSINRLSLIDYESMEGSNYYYTGCNYNTQYKPRPMDYPGLNPSDCAMWGNPIAEMMFETLRYFSGATAAHATYDYGSGASKDATHNLPKPAWTPPYEPRLADGTGGGGYLHCAKPVMTVISDINPSFDYKLPGSRFQSIAADAPQLTGFNVSTETDAVGSAEGIHGRSYFIGQSNAGNANDAPSPKQINSLSYARGLSPEEPSKRGTYYASGVARYGALNSIAGNADGRNPVMTYSVALASPLPEIRIPIPGTTPVRYATVVPFAKSVRSNFNPPINPSIFTPTNPLVDYYIDTIANTGAADTDMTVNGGRPYAEFRINFEDMEVGSDWDMDTIVKYTVAVQQDNTLKVDLSTDFKAGSTVQHHGYVITGTTKDGTYMVVDDTQNAGVFYDLNTPAGRDPGYCIGRVNDNQCKGLPKTSSRTFTLSAAGSEGDFLRDPLWYAAKYGRPPSFAWDEDGDGEPDNYFLVTNAGTLKEQLEKAFSQIIADTQNSGGVAASGARVTEGFMAYVPSFKATDWTGDLLAHKLDPATGALLPALWSVKDRLAVPSDAAVRTQTGRKVYYIDPAANAGARQKDFTRTGLGGTAMAATRLGLPSATPVATVDNLINYLRGDHSLEQRMGGTLRDRSSRIGDIFSQPVVLDKASYGYVNLPVAQGGGYGTGGYAEFVESKETRIPTVFVAANDGFIHAFDGREVGGGGELFAIAPSNVMANMHELASPSYVHRYFVNGSPTLGDAYLGGSWKTVLVGATGAGGRSVYALDVTNPAATGDKVLWEFTDPDLGLTIGNPKIALLNDGTWVAIFGNGYNSDNNQAFLFVVNLQTGALVRKISTNTEGTADKPNGMSTPAIIDLQGDGKTDIVYAGDYYGNLWKFDLSVATPSAQKLFTATDSGANPQRQPITGGVTASIHPVDGQLVFFGTGSYFLNGDNAAPAAGDQIQSFYGIWDQGGATVLRNQLVEQTFSAAPGGGRTTSQHALDWASHKGWFIDLQVGTAVDGERFIGQPTVALGRVFFTTYVSEGDECEPGGYNWINSLWTTSGAGGFSGTGSSSNRLDDVTGPMVEAINVVTRRSGGDEGSADCDPADEDCTRPNPDGSDADGDGNPDDLGIATPRGCVLSVDLLTAAGMNPLLRLGCGRQSWRQIH